MDNIPSKYSKFSKISIHLTSIEIEEGLEMGQKPSRVRYFRLYSIEKIENIEPNIECRKKMIDGQDCIIEVRWKIKPEWIYLACIYMASHHVTYTRHFAMLQNMASGHIKVKKKKDLSCILHDHSQSRNWQHIFRAPMDGEAADHYNKNLLECGLINQGIKSTSSCMTGQKEVLSYSCPSALHSRSKSNQWSFMGVTVKLCAVAISQHYMYLVPLQCPVHVMKLIHTKTS